MTILEKKHFQSNPLYFRVHADFEGVNGIVKSSLGDKTTNIHKRNPVCNGYYVMSGLDDVLQSLSSQSPLGFEKVDYFVIAVKLLEKKRFYFENTNKNLIMTDEDEEHFRSTEIFWFCENLFDSQTIRNHFLSTGKKRGPTHEKCNVNFKQDQNNFISFVFNKFSIFDCHLFFKNLLLEKMKVILILFLKQMNNIYQ